MVEADMFCLFGLLYSAVVCLVSMSMFWWFEVQPGWEWLADFVALAWIGFSVGALAWMKVWMVSITTYHENLTILSSGKYRKILRSILARYIRV